MLVVVRCALAVSLCVVLLAACRPTSSSSSSGARLEYGSEQDIEKLLDAHGVHPKLRACDNVRVGKGIIRSVVCETDLTAPEIATLGASMGTSPGPMGGYSGTNSCDKRAGFVDGTPGLTIEWVDSPKKQTSGISKIELRRVPSGATCVQIAYGWG